MISKRYKIHTKQIEFFNGLSSVIYSILKFFGLKYCFIYFPCCLIYKKAASNLKYDFIDDSFLNMYVSSKDSINRLKHFVLKGIE